VGSCHNKPNCRRCASGRRPRARLCLRKGCGRKYQPRRWNQRYCQDPECQRQVRRWQAAQRQAKRRLDAEAKAQHAEAQRLRRQRAKSVPQAPKNAEVAAARGHAAEFFFDYPCAPGRGATNGRCRRSATRDATAALPAVRRFAMFWIVNASGGLAERCVAVANALLSIRQRAGNGPGVQAMGPVRHRRRRLRSDAARGPRRSSTIAWPGQLD
jgi:hypothetical protein